MTSRRSIAQWDARLSRGLQFRPGHVGGRVNSAQPVVRRGGTLRRPIIAAGGAPTPLLLWWKFDEASGGVPTLLTSEDGTASFAVIPGTDTFRVTALAPDSLYAFRSSWSGGTPYATVSTGLSGTVVFDWWMDGINGDTLWPTSPYNTFYNQRTIWAARLGATTGSDAGFEVSITAAPSGTPTLRFYSLAPEGFYSSTWTGSGQVASTTTLTGPMHVVWTTNLTGTSSVSINGTTIGSATVPWGWDSESAWRIVLGACETYTDFDELVVTTL